MVVITINNQVKVEELLETEEKRVRSLFSYYQDFLNARSKVEKAAMVNRLAGIFKISLTGLKTFSD